MPTEFFCLFLDFQDFFFFIGSHVVDVFHSVVCYFWISFQESSIRLQ